MSNYVVLKNSNDENLVPITKTEAVKGLSEALVQKQDTLVSGTNIKTINGVSILGSGDITIGTDGTFIQTQVDWNQSDSTAVDYIKNKPSIPTAITIDQTYSGSSTNAQSGVAIAGALAEKQDTISDLADIRAGTSNTVKYTQQTLTSAQKEQARTNIGIEDSVLVSSESSLSPDDYNSASAQTVATALGISTAELDDLCNRKYSHIKVQNELATVSPISIGDYGNGVIVSYAQEVLMGGQMLRYYGFVLYGTSYSYTVTWFQANPILAEQTTNKVTSLSAQSTDTQYPSAKCVYDMFDGIETLLASL